MPSSFLAGMAV